MEYIVYVYADLIRKDKKTIDEVPPNIREDVQKILDAQAAK